MRDFDESWPEEVLIPGHSGFFRRALAVAASSFSSLSIATMILPKPEGPMGCMGPLDQVPGAIKVDPTFKLIYLVAVGLTVLVFVGWVVAASFAPHTDAARSLISGCETMFKLGFGALVGLLGGRTTPAPRGSRRR